MASALLIPNQTPFDAAPVCSRGIRSFFYLGGSFTIHADSQDTNGAFALVEVSGSTGGEPPLHVHSREDEMFYVLEGELTVQRGFESIVLGPGQSAFLPRNVPHTFKITSGKARALVLVTPGGFEEYFRTLASDSAPSSFPTRERMAEVAARHGINFIS